MKTLDEYMKLPYRMEIIPDTEEGGYVVSFPELPGCLTCADTLEQAAVNGEEAKENGLSLLWKMGLKFLNLSALTTIQDSSNFVFQNLFTML